MFSSSFLAFYSLYGFEVADFWGRFFRKPDSFISAVWGRSGNVRSQRKPVVHWVPKVLLAAQITFRGLYRCVSEQELNLLQFTATLALLFPIRAASTAAAWGLRHRTVSCNWPARSAAMGRIKRSMAKRQSKAKPAWAETKAKLAGFDRAALLDLVHSLYAAHQHSQAFLHARLSLGEDTLEPFKKVIHRWLRPDLSRRQDVSVARAKRAISDYKKALGDPEGVAELMVFYCVEAVGFYDEMTYDDAGYLDALVRMFEQALHTTSSLSANVQRG